MNTGANASLNKQARSDFTVKRLLPTPAQLDFLNWEFGVFFHFGIRSFFPGHQDWDGKPMPAEQFNPQQLDCEQWISLSAQAGAKYAILVCKHHDGFANWPSKYSDYSVAQTPWKDGKGDVVREFVDACRKYDLKVGLYYSPAQWGGKVNFNEDKEYDDYFIHQISELLSNYGKIDYLWFDGCGSENHEYDKDRIISVIRSLQPGILIFNMWDPDTRWVGNEDGHAPMPNFYTCASTDFSMMTSRMDALSQECFLPAECDCKMRSTWFDCEDNEKSVKTLEELMGMYERSVGRGANLLLNIGPDCRGLLPEKDAKRLLELGDEIRRRYGSPLPFGPMKKQSETEYAIQAPSYTGEFAHDATEQPLVNRVMIQEDISQGEAVTAFRIHASLPGYQAKSICIYKGDTIGHKAICIFPAIRTGKITVEIEKANGEVRLADLKAFYA